MERFRAHLHGGRIFGKGRSGWIANVSGRPCVLLRSGEEGLHRNSVPATSETNRIFIARFDGESRVLESYVSRDRGANYLLEQTIRKIPAEQGDKIWRPVVPIHAQDNMPVYWHEGRYECHSGGWHCDVVMYVEYDD